MKKLYIAFCIYLRKKDKNRVENENQEQINLITKQFFKDKSPIESVELIKAVKLRTDLQLESILKDCIKTVEVINAYNKQK